MLFRPRSTSLELGRVALVALFLATATAALLLPYNAHSFDDLGMWPQLVLKGVRWIKVDVQLATQQACQNFSSWNSTAGQCYPFDGLTVCCLALRGDTSSAPKLPGPFNTSTDLVRLLDSMLAAPCRKGQAPLQLHLQLDFCTGTHEGSAAHALFQDFMAKLNSTKSKTSPCLQVFTPGYLGDTPLAINDEMGSLPGDCSAGKWPSSPLPYMFWEPSTEKDIVNTLGEFEHCKTLPPSHSLVRNGSCYACNLEQEMFEVYSATVLNEQSTSPSGANHSTLLPLVKSSSMVVIPGADLDSSTVAVAYSTTATNEHFLDTFTASLSRRVAHVALNVSTGAGIVNSLSTAGGHLLVGTNSGQLLLFAVRDQAPVRLPLQQTAQSVRVFSTSLLRVGTSNVDVVFARDGASKSECSVSVDVVAVCQSGCAASSSIVSSECVVPKAIAVTSASVSLAQTTGLQWEGLLVYSALNSSLISSRDVPAWSPRWASEAPQAGVSLVYAAGLMVNSSALQLAVVRGPQKRLDFGSQPHIQVCALTSSSGPTLVAVEAHNNGMCQTGLGINNGDFDHCSIPDGAIPGLASVPELLNYNYGLLDDWLSAIESGRHFQGGCDTRIVHAKYDMGSAPSISLLHVPSAEPPLTQAVALHTGSTGAAGLGSICGMATPRNETVIDRFNVPSVDSLLAFTT